MFYVEYIIYLSSILALHIMLFVLYCTHLDASLLSLVFGNWIRMQCHGCNLEHLMFFILVLWLHMIDFHVIGLSFLYFVSRNLNFKSFISL